MATVRYFYHGFIHSGTTFMYIQYSAPLFITFFQMFRRCRTPSARPSLLIFHIDHIDWYVYLLCCIGSLAVIRSLRRRDRNRMDSYRVSTVDVPESHISSGAIGPWQQQQCNSLHCHEEWWGSVTPILFSWALDDYDLFAKVKEPLLGTRYNTRDERVRAIGRSIRNINKDGHADGVRRLPNIWRKWYTGCPGQNLPIRIFNISPNNWRMKMPFAENDRGTSKDSDDNQ